MSVALSSAPPAASAAVTRIGRFTTPAGIEVWLVREATVPLVAMEFAFRGGAAQDPAGRPGVAAMLAALLDEGAGDLTAQAFHERLEAQAIELSFDAGRDHVRGALRTLTDHLDDAFELTALALNAPRFDAEPIERVRQQTLAALRRESTDPDSLARRRWSEIAFGAHPYGRQVRGTAESVGAITRADLLALKDRILTRDGLVVAVVGDIAPERLAPLVDKVFGPLPATAMLAPVPAIVPQGLGSRVIVPIDVPQSVITFGGQGIERKDADFIPAVVLNHILGGGSFSSRLYREVRESRGLAYSVSTGLSVLDAAAVFIGGVATRNERASEALSVIEDEIRKLAATGPTDDELAKAKSYLVGSYALRFDTSRRIAGQLVQIRLDDLGIDWIERRNRLVAAVTAADMRRVARRLFGAGEFLVTIAGKPEGLTDTRRG